MGQTQDLALLARMTDVERQSGDIAIGYFRPGTGTSARIDSKAGGSPVTEADHRVDAFLASELSKLVPEAGWLSEETEDSDARLSRDLIFVVDPIDGTRAFMTGDPRWAVCIALVSRGEPVLGIVHLPARAETFVASRGGGAFRNNVPIRVASRQDLDGGTFAGPASLLKTLAAAGIGFHTEPRIPSLAYRLVRVAEGTLDASLASTDACDWDIAAADVIVHEAGGRLTDLEGNRPTYNRAETRHGVLGAAPAQLQNELTAALRNALGGTKQT